MRNRGAIILLSVLLAIISLYYLSFTFVVNKVEGDAEEYAQAYVDNGNYGNLTDAERNGLVDKQKKAYLDSIDNQVVWRYIKKYTYKDCKERELNLGLDLKGGMNISLEISAEDVLLSLTNNDSDPALLQAIENARKETANQTGTNFIETFGKAYKELQMENKPNLAVLFCTSQNTDKIKISSTDDEVIDYLTKEYDAAIGNAYDVINKRIDQFGVVQPNIQKDVAVKGVFHIELPGIKDPERVEKLLKQAAVLEFWETYNYDEIRTSLIAADQTISALKKAEASRNGNSAPATETEPANEVAEADTTAVADSTATEENVEENAEEANTDSEYSIFNRLLLQAGGHSIGGPVVGFAKKADMESIMADLNRNEVKPLFKSDLVFKWGFKEVKDAPGYYELIALKKSKDGKAALNGEVVTDARQEFGQTRATAEVTMAMNNTGSTQWARITKENIGRCIAIVLDDAVYSFPRVNDEIKGGRSQITGDFTLTEATDLANVLKAGKMTAPAIILSKEVVGPSLGQKAIDSGMYSFIIAFILVLIYMIFYYNKAGIVADVALICNLFLIFGVMASLGAVLTLPGIAGMVLTIGMSVDANVLIYERIREEMRAGKMIKAAVADGYKNAYSAILDSNITTILIGIVLAYFGVGPVRGFATTLIIGILTSLFTAIFITRLIFTSMLNKESKITLGNKMTNNAFTNLNFDFLKGSKIAFIISGTLIVVGIISLCTLGLKQGIDFTGGRNYVVKFENNVVPEEVANALEASYGERPVVKTFGDANQVKVTTQYKIDQIKDRAASEESDNLLYEGLKNGKFIPENVDKETFFSDYRQTSQIVGPTVADDIKTKSSVAILLGLVVMFLYILLRFRKWQYSLGATIALIHDVLITLGLFSLLYAIMPFNMEIDQAFIAAILTIVGYSINDTVVIFDRIREYTGLYPNRDRKSVINSAVNSTVGRTINTSMTTLVVLLAIFIFGGESIRGFCFALLIGVIVGTYSSIFIASPMAYIFGVGKKKEEKK
ncbi:MAG: protein translocase subunit SecDF [Bacteroidales bacterium]|nr:protein translocase subunit SecDF [Bacteroidales bacterium]